MRKSNPLTRGKKQRALALMQAGNLNDARTVLEQVCKTDPRDAEAWAQLGTICSTLGHYEQAVGCLSNAVRIDPVHGVIHHNLAHAYQAAGRFDEAAASYREAIRLQPDLAAAHCNLGTVYEALHRFPEAISSYREAVRLLPQNADVHYNLGNALLRNEQAVEAADAFRAAIGLRPGHADARLNLGIAELMSGNEAAAEATFREAIRINPNHAAAYEKLGKVLDNRDAFTEAIGCYRRAIELDPRPVQPYRGLATVLWKAGEFDESMNILWHVLEKHPEGHPARRSLAVRMNYLESIDASSAFAEQVALGRDIAQSIPVGTEFSNSRDPERRLRIGYVSGDFRSHSVAYFIEEILAQHDRQQFETFCYANVLRADHVTDRLKRRADNWRDIAGQDDADSAALIRRDEIDILIDLAGHTVGNRLPMFARKPAPIQVTYLGYPNTTGLTTIDYRLTDAIADPPGQEAFHTERLVRLPHGFLCYRPVEGAPVVQPPPALTAGHVTFGSFNNLTKINIGVVTLWTKILQAVPNSRLILKNKSLRDDGVRDRHLAKFNDRGISTDRVELIGYLDRPTDHLALYNRIDVALDTFPYNGTTTTCEAMWMGVPVVTLAGDRHAGRVGVSLLTQVGLAELIAKDPEEYVQLAVELAGNPERLSRYRATMRERMQNSPLCDAKTFTRDLEEAYREMWRGWCAGG